MRSPPPEIPALLARGDIDGFFLWEPWPTRALKQGARVLMTSGDVGYRSTMLAVASTAWLRAHPAEAATFMKVLSESCREIRADPERAVAAVQAAIKMPAEDVRNLVKGSECSVRDIGETDVQAFDEVADFLASKRTTPTKISVRPTVELGFMTKNAGK